jgi:urea transport system substrate-binding protein
MLADKSSWLRMAVSVALACSSAVAIAADPIKLGPFTRYAATA